MVEPSNTLTPDVRGLRSVFGDAFVYSFSVASPPLAMAAVTPIVARKLEPSAYGVLDVVLALASLVSVVALLGLDAAVSRSYVDVDPAERDERARVVTTGLLLALVAGVGGVMAAAILGLAVELAIGGFATATFVATAAAAGLSVPLTNGQGVARMSFVLARRRKLFTTAGILQAGVGAIVACLLVLLGLGPAGFVLGFAFGSAVALGYSFIAGKIAPSDHRWYVGRLAGEMLRYGLPLVPASAAAWIVFAVDRTLIASIRNFTEAGYYGLASRATVPMMLAISAFGVAWGPYILAQPQATRPETRARALTAASAAAAAIFVCVVTFREELVVLLGGREFEPAARAVPGIALGWLGWAAAAVLASEFAVLRRTRVIAVVIGAAAVLNVALNLVAVPRFGFVGASWVTAATFIVVPLSYWIWERRSGLAPYRYGRLAVLGVIVLLATVGPPLVGDHDGLLSKVVLCIVAVSALAWVGGSDRTTQLGSGAD